MTAKHGDWILYTVTTLREFGAHPLGYFLGPSVRFGGPAK